jgi:hypothetical protein
VLRQDCGNADVRAYVAEHPRIEGAPPTEREPRAHFGTQPTPGMHERVHRTGRCGLIADPPGRSGTLRIVGQQSPTHEFPCGEAGTRDGLGEGVGQGLARSRD